ncbi:MAG: polysaccharide biosynthesis protein [Xanthobacteraceae bacterium]|jgi:UDP-glucose 4-epimerase
MSKATKKLFDSKRILITGGTGSLGKVLLRRLLAGDAGRPEQIVVLSRDEAKQHQIRVEYQHRYAATDEVIYQNFRERLSFRIGDVRDYSSVCAALKEIDIVFNAAALKQVPTCEYFPYEAVQTNIHGPENIVRAIRDFRLPVQTVIGISTDKAVKPVNVMGMTKSIQERIFLRGNLEMPETRFIVVRYGNVLASRGSVIPLFHEQIKNGGPVTITHPDMTRFLLSLDEAVDLIFTAVRKARRGETFIPRVPSARIVDVAAALIGNRDIKTLVTGIRPGEKLHEILISEEESHRTFASNDVYVIGPILPELQRSDMQGPLLEKEYSSEADVMTSDQVKELMVRRGLTVGQTEVELEGEFLR